MTRVTVASLRARVGRWLGRGGSRQWTVRKDPVAGRNHALRVEVDYWRQWLADKGGKWPEDYRYRFDSTSPIADPALYDVIGRVPSTEVSVLDVGSGPVSAIGYTFPGKTIALTAVDPLAASYCRLLDEAHVAPPVRPRVAEGERLVEQLGTEQFDVAYARNSLDHAVDPIAIIDQMFQVVRPAGYIVLRHVENEAVRQNYVQLHQWNLDERDGRFIAWRPGREVDLTDRLGGPDAVECRREPGGAPDADWIVAVAQRR